MSSIDCINCEETHGREVGALLARLFGQEFWLPRSARAQPLRLLQLRIKQNLLFDLQGVVSETAPREINAGVAGLINSATLAFTQTA